MRGPGSAPGHRGAAEQWERNVLTVTLAIFITFTGFTIVTPFLPLYITELGVKDPAQAAVWSGLIFGISPLIAGFMAPVWGAVGDKHGRKVLFVRSLIAFTVIMALTAVVTNVVQLFFLRVLSGVFGGLGAVALAMISTSVPPERASRAIGRLQAVQLLSNASGPLIGGVLASVIGVRHTFFAAAALCLLSLGAVTRYYREPPHPPPTATPVPGLPLRSLLLLPAMLPLFTLLFLSQMVDRSLAPILPLYIASLGAAGGAVAVWAGVITAAGALVSAAAADGAGRAARRFGARPLLTLSLVGGGASTVLLALVRDLPQLFAARCLLGLLAGGIVTLAFALGNRYVPEESKGAAFGVLSAGSMLAGGIGPQIAGALAAVEVRLVFAAGAVFYLGAVWAGLSLPRGTPPPAHTGRLDRAPRDATRESTPVQ